MAEVTLDLRGLPKPEAYEQLAAQADVVLEGIDDEIAEMATIAALIYHGFGVLWAGFYRVISPDLLRVGPYQGTLGCLEIAMGRGVCGAAARDGKALIVPDVNAFPGHIACDSRSRSEMVIPVFGPGREVIAVLDIDAQELARFDWDDARGLERIVARFTERRGRCVGPRAEARD